MPSKEEIIFVLELLEVVIKPALGRVRSLLETVNTWDNADRNDFCRFVILFLLHFLNDIDAKIRYLHAARSAWSGLPTIYKDIRREAANSLIRDTDVFPNCPVYLDLNAGFALTDPEDPRYRAVVGHRDEFGHVLHDAAVLLRDKDGGEDHIDAVLSVIRAIDVHMLEYAMSRSNFASLRKNYSLARE